MKRRNLILKFKLAEEAGIQVRSAARITIDGSGTVVIHPIDDGPAERIQVPPHLFSIESLPSRFRLVQ